jgi:hypothetical protein
LFRTLPLSLDVLEVDLCESGLFRKLRIGHVLPDEGYTPGARREHCPEGNEDAASNSQRDFCRRRRH